MFIRAFINTTNDYKYILILLLNMSTINRLLINYGISSEENLLLIGRTLYEIPMYIIQGITITPNLESGIKKFTLYATNNYSKKSISRYDTIQVSYENELIFAQIHGILNIKDQNTNHILLIVHKLKKSNKNRSDYFLPYDLYQYDIHRYTGPEWDVIEPSMIYRPAILIPCFDRSKDFNYMTFNYDKLKDFRFWIIPYETVDVNGYDMIDIEESVITNMQTTFDEINQSQANLEEDGYYSDGSEEGEGEGS